MQSTPEESRLHPSEGRKENLANIVIESAHSVQHNAGPQNTRTISPSPQSTFETASTGGLAAAHSPSPQSSSAGTLEIVDSAEIAQETLRSHDNLVQSVASSHDGKDLVSGSTDKVRDAETEEAIETPYRGHDDSISSVVFSPDGKRLASGSGDRTVRVWDIKTGKAVGEPCRGHSRSVLSVVFSHDSKRLASGSADQTVRVWDAETGKAIGEPYGGHKGMVLSVVFSHDSKHLASGSTDKTIRVWDTETGKAIREPFGDHDSQVESVVFLHNSKRITSCTQDNIVRVWDIKTGKVVGAPFKVPGPPSVWPIALSQDGKYIISTTPDVAFQVWDTETREAVGAQFGSRATPKSLAFSYDRKYLVSGFSDRTVRVWDAETGKAVGAPFSGHEGTIWSVAFSHDSKHIVSGSSEGEIRVWGVEIGKEAPKQDNKVHSSAIPVALVSLPSYTRGTMTGRNDQQQEGHQPKLEEYQKMVREEEAEAEAERTQPHDHDSGWVYISRSPLLPPLPDSPDSPTSLSLQHQSHFPAASSDSDSQVAPLSTSQDEQAQEGHDPDNSTSQDGRSRRLEKLMKMHTPQDLTGQVWIPNYQHQAHGGLAVVYRGLWGSTKVAIKVLKFRRSGKEHADWDESNTRRVQREIKVWAALRHRNILELSGYSVEFADFPAMISPWCEGGTASEYLREHELAVHARVTLTHGVSEGIHYLHQLKVIHGDIKPANILVDGEGVPKLCDFGLVRLADWEGPAGMTTTTPYTGTERYKAPELFISRDNRRPVATFEGDIYSFGCVILELIERICPFRRFSTTYDLIGAIMDEKRPALRSETTDALLDMTEYLWNLMEACWGDPPDRPTISRVVEALEYFRQTIPSSQ